MVWQILNSLKIRLRNLNPADAAKFSFSKLTPNGRVPQITTLKALKAPAGVWMT